MCQITIAVLIAAALSAQSAAAADAPRHHGPPSYRVTLLSSLGGSSSRGISINDFGLVSGSSKLADGSRHASVWFAGRQRDLGTLGHAAGRNSTQVFPVKNDLGIVSGISQTDTPDPLQENWSCAAFIANPSHRICQGFVWDWSGLRALPSLGSGDHNSFATGTNNFGQTAGWAENDTHDPACVSPQVLQFKAVVWERGRTAPRALPQFASDTSSAATALNDRGQVVGISGICDQAVGRYTAAHAVIWENGRATEMVNPNGAPYWNTPNMINERGVAVGFAGVPGDEDGNFTPPFAWSRRDGFRILPMLGGDVGGSAQSINNRGQIVGYSYAADFAAHALFWQDTAAAPVDLNALADATPGFTLSVAFDINELGQITGYATSTDTSQPTEVRAFVATPRSH